MNVSVFPPGFKSPKGNKLENITLRGFGGGWNAIETDLQMDSTYLVKARNFRRTPGATQKIRYGSQWFADLSDTETGVRIVNMIYFAASIICVLSNGHIYAIDGNGLKIPIWNPTIAALLPGAPAGWSSNLDVGVVKASIDFVPYKNQLIIHNGIDKPVTISRTLVVTYLQDLASGSNVNVPIGRYGCVVSNYHCVAGIAASPTLIYISAVGTAGTFPGDPIPNDSITVDVGAFAPQGAVSIRGIAGFRANLLVFFQDQTVIVKLGTYNATGVHQPFFPDTMPSFGLLGHRCYTPIENDLLFSGLQGMASARRNLLSVSGTLETQSLSERIEPLYRETIGNLTDEQQLKDCFQVYDILAHDLLLFTSTGRIFVYSFNTKLRYSAWSEFSSINVQCGCRSFLGRVYYADGLRVYQHGNAVYDGEKFYKDRVNDRDLVWGNSIFFEAGTKALDVTNGKIYMCIRGHTSSAIPTTFAEDRTTILFDPRWEEFLGEPIDFELELPWLDSKNPMTVKFLRFIAMATKGNAKFFVSAYVDNLFKNHIGDVVFDPSLSTEFIGNEGEGFGFDAGPYGGGRRSGDPRLWKFPCKFKTLKVRIHGEEAGDLEIVNVSFLFNRGKYRR